MAGEDIGTLFTANPNSDIDITDYKMVAIDSFTDMLEIRDTINQPILMVENRKKNGVHSAGRREKYSP